MVFYLGAGLIALATALMLVLYDKQQHSRIKCCICGWNKVPDLAQTVAGEWMCISITACNKRRVTPPAA